ncbi:hypothetical protein BKA70DRAFT_1282856 [Coprinopsis sp. MPI-PUGE-AT-0042]|nr:hypothetical protein BKA70DRAFT_1282856 [Coprinopsis sp. MPI-PUGE-AT-0042]
MLKSIFYTLLLFAPYAVAHCDYAALQQFTSNYVASRLTGDVSALGSAPYTENFLPSTISKSIFASPLIIKHNRSLHDTTECATYTEMVVTDPSHPYILGTQLRFANHASKHRAAAELHLTQVESLITDAGDWLFNATAFDHYASLETWSIIPSEKRNTRAVIKAAADAYLDLWKDKTVKVPWGTPCTRLEGGAYTGTGSPTDTCNVGVPTRIVEMPNRRYVIDEQVGAVDVFVHIGNCTTYRPDSHEFRVEEGKIRLIHTMTVMDPGCGGLPSQACTCGRDFVPRRWL